jgi:hypothetical protein
MNEIPALPWQDPEGWPFVESSGDRQVPARENWCFPLIGLVALK